MYLEEKLMNISKVFQFLDQVYSVESSSLFLFEKYWTTVHMCRKLWSPEKRLFLLLLLIEPIVYSGVNSGRASSHDSKKRGLLYRLLFLANTSGTVVGTPTPGTSLFKFHLWNPCRRWLHRLKEILQRFLLLTDANFRFFSTFEPLYQVAHTIHTCG